jgi:hypothetical protein
LLPKGDWFINTIALRVVLVGAFSVPYGNLLKAHVPGEMDEIRIIFALQTIVVVFVQVWLVRHVENLCFDLY